MCKEECTTAACRCSYCRLKTRPSPDAATFLREKGVVEEPMPLVEARCHHSSYSLLPLAATCVNDHLLICKVQSEDDSMDNIGEIPILLEWNHEFQLCWNGITNSYYVGITEVDA
uniref:Uncharacterized protein n=1 Tax=Lactuca sativa TaxID=4236 RepID=A0A9R1WJG7_LACSA|nr:hypothetical protein LSAT_V11C100022220 [Lactuca sativa]